MLNKKVMVKMYYIAIAFLPMLMGGAIIISAPLFSLFMFPSNFLSETQAIALMYPIMAAAFIRVIYDMARLKPTQNIYQKLMIALLLPAVFTLLRFFLPGSGSFILCRMYDGWVTAVRELMGFSLIPKLFFADGYIISLIVITGIIILSTKVKDIKKSFGWFFGFALVMGVYGLFSYSLPGIIWLKLVLMVVMLALVCKTVFSVKKCL